MLALCLGKRFLFLVLRMLSVFSLLHSSLFTVLCMPSKLS
eukprot:COSAG01_NODE_2011_length_8656_cov_4.852402_3_plen_40_part_00